MKKIKTLLLVFTMFFALQAIGADKTIEGYGTLKLGMPYNQETMKVLDKWADGSPQVAKITSEHFESPLEGFDDAILFFVEGKASRILVVKKWKSIKLPDAVKEANNVLRIYERIYGKVEFANEFLSASVGGASFKIDDLIKELSRGGRLNVDTTQWWLKEGFVFVRGQRAINIILNQPNTATMIQYIDATQYTKFKSQEKKEEEAKKEAESNKLKGKL